MKRALGMVLGLAVVAALACLPALFWNVTFSSDQSYEETTIRKYDAEFTVGENGRMDVTETLTVDFPSSGKHGIFRFWDVADENAPTLRRVPEDIEVTRDGQPEEWEQLEEDRGRYEVARFGSQYVTLDPGLHTYEISYSVDDVLIPDPDDASASELYWNLVPGGWQQPIDRALLTVHLPAPAEDVQCGVGWDSTTGCDVAGEGTQTLVVKAKGLAPRTPVTVLTTQDVPVPPVQGEQRPWSARWDRVLGPGPVALGAVLLLALLLGVWGSVLGARSREPKPGFPLQYAPPDDIGPAQGQYILTEGIKREAFVASILQAAEKGAVTLGHDGDRWSLTDKAGPAGWRPVDPVTGTVARLLDGPGDTFTADPSSVSAGKKLKSRVDTFERELKTWARSNNLLVPSGLGGLGGLLVLLALVAMVLALTWNPLDMTMTALVPAAFGLGAISLLRPGAGTRRTATGRDLWSRVGGFHRVLSTPSSENRFDFSGRQELYTAYIPWAVAFGCADVWAAKYRTETGTEPPVPTYFPVGGSWTHGDPTSSMVDSFSHTVDSAISSYEATQRSSSSGGGGGFSGGGGGGGGGGGSW
ncbi:DUF2207 domain-containing protein [Nocardioides taihuensis]|uniref:DUF2207 domain-containing protein n=1 Tax=Nocardioides taihuensis TaxID=1835606 RepID=A0ABW0BF00_9ACTN